MNKTPLFTQFPVTSHTNFVTPGGTFVAIKGQKQDGTQYIQQALEAGATTIVIQNDTIVSPELETAITTHNAQVVRVENTRKALAELSAQAAGFPAEKLKIFGVTGTKGKTTTTWMMGHLLKAAGKKVAFVTTAGFFLTTDGATNELEQFEAQEQLTTPQPDFLHQFLKLCVEKGIEYVALEVAAQAVTFNRIDGIKFDGLIFTNLDREHAELYPTMEEYYQEKAKIFTYAKDNAALLINGDDEYGKRLLKELPQAKSFGLYRMGEFDRAEDGVEYYKTTSETDYSGSVFEDTLTKQKLIIDDNHEKIKLSYQFFPGIHNYLNFLAASSLLRTKGISLAFLNGTDLDIPRIPGRMDFYRLPKNILCCVDYAHTPKSFEATLSTLRDFTKQLVVVFGAGGGKDHLKRPLMGKIAGKLADVVIVTNDNPRYEDPKKIINQIVSGVKPKHKSKLIIEENRFIAIFKAFDAALKGSIIVLLGKGADEGQIIKGEVAPYSEREAIEMVWQRYAFRMGKSVDELVTKELSSDNEPAEPSLRQTPEALVDQTPEQSSEAEAA